MSDLWSIELKLVSKNLTFRMPLCSPKLVVARLNPPRWVICAGMRVSQVVKKEWRTTYIMGPVDKRCDLGVSNLEESRTRDGVVLHNPQLASDFSELVELPSIGSQSDFILIVFEFDLFQQARSVVEKRLLRLIYKCMAQHSQMDCAMGDVYSRWLSHE